MPPSADEILARSLEVYSTCRSYRDRGESTSRLTPDDRPQDWQLTVLEFETLFTRPPRIKWVCWDRQRGLRADGCTAVWPHGDRYRSWSTIMGKLEEHDTPEDPLGAYVGTSDGVSYLMATRLVRSKGRRRPHLQPRSCELAGSEEVRGSECWKLVGTLGRDTRIALWIDRESHLLLRLTEDQHHRVESIQARLERARAVLGVDFPREDADSFRTAKVVELFPQLDVPIEDSEFEFVPPSPTTEAP